MNFKTSLFTIALGFGALQGLNACSGDTGSASDSTDQGLPKDPIDPPDPDGRCRRERRQWWQRWQRWQWRQWRQRSGGSGPATPRVIDFDTAQIVETQVDIESGRLVKYETRNCSAGADPIMHLFKPGNTSEERIQLAIDDNSAGGVNALISLTPTSGGIGFLVLRAKNDAFGTCDIWRNNYPWRYGINVGGKTVSVSGMLSSDAVETVARPGGWEVQTVYRLSGANITTKIRSGTGTGGGVRFSLGTSAASFLVSGSGPTRVVVNDASSDTDGDGLGNRVENELGTCSGANAFGGSFDCSLAKTPKDTDGDGISDGFEVIGKRDQQPHQLLPQWGANPRHKDLFVEVDFLDDGLGVEKMSTSAVRRVAAYWQDTIEATTPAVQAARAAALRNPDQKPGFALHVDSGMPPAVRGRSQGSAPRKLGWIQHASRRELLWLTPGPTTCHPARRGVFHWVLGVRNGGGQANGFPVTAGINNPDAMAHELGHTMGLGHDGACFFGRAQLQAAVREPDELRLLVHRPLVFRRQRARADEQSLDPRVRRARQRPEQGALRGPVPEHVRLLRRSRDLERRFRSRR